MKPILLTPGEPAGIGPELAVAVAATRPQLILVADPGLLERTAAATGTPVRIQLVETTGEPAEDGALRCLPVTLAQVETPGRLNPANGPYVLECLDRAATICMQGQAGALVTGPVHKGVINEGGTRFSGHTEFLAARSGIERVVMMLVARQLRVALATTHLPLSQVPAAIVPDELERTLTILDRELTRLFAILAPRIAVLGLNPHAGEDGYLGTEEIEVIAPVIERLRSRGMDLSGPLPADTAFVPRRLERFDAVLAMYHDQGLPVLKYAGFGQAVNVTLGLPFVRTSVDHGTALDLAGTGRADPGSLEAAIDLAERLSRNLPVDERG